MSTPIAIIHWESNATLGSGKPRVAHIFDAEKDLTNRDFVGITKAVIFALPGYGIDYGQSKLLRAASELSSEAQCRVTVQPFGPHMPFVFSPGSPRYVRR